MSRPPRALSDAEHLTNESSPDTCTEKIYTATPKVTKSHIFRYEIVSIMKPLLGSARRRREDPSLHPPFVEYESLGFPFRKLVSEPACTRYDLEAIDHTRSTYVFCATSRSADISRGRNQTSPLPRSVTATQKQFPSLADLELRSDNEWSAAPPIHSWVNLPHVYNHFGWNSFNSRKHGLYFRLPSASS